MSSTNTAEAAPQARPWLDHDELIALTGYTRASNQREALDGLGIVYRRRWDGKNIVLRSALVDEQPARRRRTAAEPDWGAV